MPCISIDKNIWQCKYIRFGRYCYVIAVVLPPRGIFARLRHCTLTVQIINLPFSYFADSNVSNRPMSVTYHYMYLIIVHRRANNSEGNTITRDSRMFVIIKHRPCLRVRSDPLVSILQFPRNFPRNFQAPSTG